MHTEKVNKCWNKFGKTVGAVVMLHKYFFPLSITNGRSPLK